VQRQQEELPVHGARALLAALNGGGDAGQVVRVADMQAPQQELVHL
jgi:hypothetical protein